MNIGLYYPKFGVLASVSYVPLIIAFANADSDDGQDSRNEDNIDKRIYNAQLNFDYKFYETKSFFISVSMATGYFYYKSGSENEKTKIPYVGPAFHLLYDIFFLEIGAGFGRDYGDGDNDFDLKIIPLVQLGVLVKYSL